MSRLFTTIAGLRSFLAERPSVGLVPTMGALHDGHGSLIARCRAENETTVVSIFVNPIQFVAGEDYDRYPRSLERDRQFCRELGVDAIFAPPVAEMLDGDTRIVPPAAMTAGLCGRSRPGHFTGVATIVMKLLQIVRPQYAYFGQKDGQQLAIVRRLLHDLNVPVQAIACPTIREPDGLALSSRNQYLTPVERAIAPNLYQSLLRARDFFGREGERSTSVLLNQARDFLKPYAAIELEYLDLVHPDTLSPLERLEDPATGGMLAIAARIGTTRLIDNILLQQRRPIIAIDGPAGSGKSTVARQVARHLGFLNLDTGAMYRAVTLAVLRAQLDLGDIPAIAEATGKAQVDLVPQSDAPSLVLLNGTDVTQEIRSTEVTRHVSTIAAQAIVRQIVVQRQQAIGKSGGVVIEGRDIGTKVFPDAEIKVFLTASARERARRRHRELIVQGETTADLEAIARDIQERDAKDSTREVSPLRQAPDAIAIHTDGLSIEEVVQRIVELYETRLNLS